MGSDSFASRTAARIAALFATVAPDATRGQNDRAPAPAPAPVAHSAPVRTGYAWVNGLRMYYEVHGEGGMPLVLLHGGGSTIATNFARILPTLQQTRQVIAVEFQAHGHTRDVDRAFTFEQDADDVAAVLAHLRVDKADVLGFSNGGTTALQVAIRHPEMVDHLVIASANYRKDGMHPWFWVFMRNGSFADMPQVYKDEYLKINPSEKDLYMMYERDSKRMLTFRDIADEEIHNIVAPTLVVAGDQDVVRPEHAVELSRLVQHGRLCILPGNHGSYMGEIMSPFVDHTVPERFVGIVEEFLMSRGE
jgi:pimeloyl-ACP methyl ester carboxylesterase